MKKLYKQPYFNRKNWILENFDKLNLTSDEAMLLLLVDYAKESKANISYDYFKNKLHCNSKKIDEIVASLVNKSYLTIKPTKTGISFDIDNVFEFDPEKYETADAKDVYSVAESIFKRPLTSIEVQKFSDLSNTYSQEDVVDALRTAEAYRKVSVSYVETILKNEKR